MLRPLLIAGSMLFIMSVMDTLAYGVRTAGVLMRRLAMSLSLFNTLVVVSRFGNMLQAAVLGTLPDQVGRGLFTADDVVRGLRLCLLFVVAGVIVGAILMPTFIRLISRGLEILEERGSAPKVMLYAIMHCGRFPHYFTLPGPHIREYLNIRRISLNFLVLNILVTAFYSIGVMSTFVAASRDLSLNSTSNNLSGIVNGIASVLLFIFVDPPASIIIDQCIRGKRPVADAKILNVYLVITRLMGVCLGILLLPYAATYVHMVAVWFSHLYK